VYWYCAQVEPRRERLASYTLGLAGYEIYQPLLREQRRSRSGRKITVTPPLFPGYLFLWVVSGWWDARWSPGVVRLIMDGVLPRSRGFVPGMRVRVVSGLLQNQIGLLGTLRPHERVLVLLHLLGGQQRVELAQSAIEVMGSDP